MWQSIEGFVQKKTGQPVKDDSGTVETRSFEQKRAEIAAAKIKLIAAWELPPLPPRNDQLGPTRPSYDIKWVRGLYDVAEQVASGKMDPPDRRYFHPACPKELRHKGMTEQKVVAHFRNLPVLACASEEPMDPVKLGSVAASDGGSMLAVGSQVQLLCWKRSQTYLGCNDATSRVLAYPSCVGTVASIEERNGSTFVKVDIKPVWFSPRTVQVFKQEIELINKSSSQSAKSVQCESTQPAPTASSVRTKKKTYSLGEMQVFEAFTENFYKQKVGATLGMAVTAIKDKMPTLYPKLKTDTAKRFPDKIEKLQQQEKMRREKKRKKAKLLKAGDKKAAPSMEEKEEQLKQVMEERSSGKGGNRRVIPITLFVSLGMLLYAMCLAGAPLTSGTALPTMVAHIRAEGFGDILHSFHSSPQGLVALRGNMKDHGLVPEPGRIWLSTKAICKFYLNIGMSMRAGTSSISKKPAPAEVASLRNVMKLRLVFSMVTHNVIPKLVFQMDETGVSLLPFSKRGRAQMGASEVNWHGWDEKRQFTITPIIDGESKLVEPTQMI